MKDGSGVTKVLFVSMLVSGIMPGVLKGAPPMEPLGTPLYSFDLASPAVMSGFVNASDVLVLKLPYPAPIISKNLLGLGAAGDDLDAISGGHSLISPNATFAFRFSVTRETTGTVAVDSSMILTNVPFNVTDQAARGHQAGDEFISLRLYNLANGDAQKPESKDNNTMVNNNYDEGGSDFAGRPETSATTMTVGQPQDNVDGIANIDATAALFYSATSTSPSLATLPDATTSSGAKIFRMFAGAISAYATPSQLGLLAGDDIDALIVFDFNLDGTFNGTDRVLFSLSPSSPSLTLINNASSNAAADIFIASPGEAARLFAPAAKIGLTGPSDDIDALEILLCRQPQACAALHGIRN